MVGVFLGFVTASKSISIKNVHIAKDSHLSNNLKNVYGRNGTIVTRTAIVKELSRDLRLIAHVYRLSFLIFLNLTIAFGKHRLVHFLG